MRQACFPEYLALVNPAAAQAYAMCFVKEEVRESTSFLAESSGMPDTLGPREWSPKKATVVTIFDWTNENAITDAFLIVSPYVILPDKPKELGGATLTFKMDGYTLIEREPLVNYTLEDKYCLKPLRYKGHNIFQSAILDENGLANTAETYGVMAPNGSSFQVLLHRLDPGKEQVRIQCGLVAALYTTKKVQP